mmetsp:Transcript_488/g.819  ORF Transcript_488/g.819 Transcript_488/m.819 type:complete len:130 (+) Transcript_488:1025-1414(+)
MRLCRVVLAVGLFVRLLATADGHECHGELRPGPGEALQRAPLVGMHAIDEQAAVEEIADEHADGGVHPVLRVEQQRGHVALQPQPGKQGDVRCTVPRGQAGQHRGGQLAVVANQHHALQVVGRGQGYGH